MDWRPRPWPVGGRVRGSILGPVAHSNLRRRSRRADLGRPMMAVALVAVRAAGRHGEAASAHDLETPLYVAFQIVHTASLTVDECSRAVR